MKTEHLDGINLEVPRSIPGIDDKFINPRNSWSDPADYDKQATKLIQQFRGNFTRFDVSDAIIAAGPQ